jgi:hypothetical protein
MGTPPVSENMCTTSSMSALQTKGVKTIQHVPGRPQGSPESDSRSPPPSTTAKRRLHYGDESIEQARGIAWIAPIPWLTAVWNLPEPKHMRRCVFVLQSSRNHPTLLWISHILMDSPQPQRRYPVWIHLSYVFRRHVVHGARSFLKRRYAVTKEILPIRQTKQ